VKVACGVEYFTGITTAENTQILRESWTARVTNRTDFGEKQSGEIC